MKKIIVILNSILVVSVIAGGAYIWDLMQQPLYEPGMVRAEKNLRAPLVPSEQLGDSPMWRVEEDIELFHFAEGEGRNAQFQIIEDAGHFSFLEQPDLFAQTVSEFLADLQ